MLRERSFREAVKHFLDESIHAAFSIIGGRLNVRTAYERLLLRVHQHTNMLRPRARCGDRRGNGRCAMNAALGALALHHEQWLRPVETWMPVSTSPWPQFTSLARHLFAQYPVPAFMTSVWFEFPPGEPLPYHRWYIHLGHGGSLRTLDLPLVFTKTMVHWFNQAPDHYKVKMAVRWAQVRGLGGDEKLAGAVAATRLGQPRLGQALEHEDFWLTVLRFLVSHPRMDLAQVGPIVDFLQHQRFEHREVIMGGALRKVGPPQPEYSMKGRTLRSLLRQVDDWHEELGRERIEAPLRWSRSTIGEFELVEGSEHLNNVRRWTITELLTNRELGAEGLALHHCVAIYARQCAKKQTSIWSFDAPETNRGDRFHHGAGLM
jgi:hypothetical protein